MSKNPSVIEINNQRYDAITGKLIGAVKKITQPNNGGNLDGFTRLKPHSAKSHSTRHKQPASRIHKRAQKTKTLMRSGVKRPAALKNFQRIISSRAISPARLTRAATIHKSSKVKKYSSPAQKDLHKSSASLPGKVINPTPVGQNQAGLVLAKRLPSMVTSVSHQRLERMLDEALSKADAHKKMLKQLQKRSWWNKIGLPKWLSISLIVVLALVSGGIYAWEKIPQVSVRLAASKAKISATVPEYKPEGFSVKGPAKYQSGSVVMDYVASGSQSYTISQKASDWDSLSLAANAIPSNTPVQSSQVNGKTVYIYGPNNDAAWVNNGIKYKLDNHASLGSDQIIKIANGL